MSSNIEESPRQQEVSLNSSDQFTDTFEEAEYVPDPYFYILRTIKKKSPNLSPNPQIDTPKKMVSQSTNTTPTISLQMHNETIGENSNLIEVSKLTNGNEIAKDENTGLTANTLNNCSSIVAIEVANKFPEIHDNDKENNEVDNLDLSPVVGSQLNFNDTLEQVEYMIEQAQKLKINTDIYMPNESKFHQATPLKVSKSCVTPISRKRPKTPFPMVLNQKNIFKKPQKITTMTHFSSTDKIPKAKNITLSAKSKLNFNHIVSPIGIYIKNQETIPSMINCHHQKEFYNSTICENMKKELDQSTSDSNCSGDGTSKSSSDDYKSNRLPKKVYISAPFCCHINERTVTTTGSGNMNKITGRQPQIISHNKDKIDSEHNQVNMTDISVHVERDVKRV